jgi:putative transposase
MVKVRRVFAQMKASASDLSDAPWSILEPLIPPAKPAGRPRSVKRRHILHGIFDVLRSGRAWRLLPHEYPAWSTVDDSFRTRRQAGIWEQMVRTLRERVRVQAGRNATPSAGMMESPSVKTTQRGGLPGDDGGKKVNGRKRPLLVDTMGLLLKVVVHAAHLQDRESVNRLLEPVKGQFPRMEKVWVDQGSTGKGKTWIERHRGWTVEVVERSPPRGWIMTQDQGLVKVSLPKTFDPLPRRWVVERTIAWIGRWRRLSKEYEYRTSRSEAMVSLSMLRLMLPRLAQQNEPQFVKYKQTHAA